MNKELTELYSDYLLSSFGATTATGLSDMLEGEGSHDRITRFLSQDVYDSRTLWQQVKPMVRKMEQPDGALIFDDTIEEKPHTDENEIVSWHSQLEPNDQGQQHPQLRLPRSGYDAAGGLRNHPQAHCVQG